MCISLEFIKKDTFVQAQKELYKCVSLSNSSRKTHLYRRRKSCTNVYLCPNLSRKTHLYTCRKSCINVYLYRIHQERHICTGAERPVQMCISLIIYQERHICTGTERAVQMCISVRIYQERHICTDTERAVQMCISVELIKKDTFVQAQKGLYKCVSLSNSSGMTHL